MKRLRLLIAPALLIILLGVGWNIGTTAWTASNANGEIAQPAAPDPQKLTALGLVFTPLPMTLVEQQTQGIISAQQAVTAAQKGTPNLQSATRISTALGHLNTMNGVTMAGIDGKAPVWIVTFDGIETVSSGPPGAARKTAQQYNIVIDAKTGAYIVGFPT